MLEVALSLATLALFGWACPSGDRGTQARDSVADTAAPSYTEEGEVGESGGTCRVPYTGPVAIVALNTPQAFARAIAERPSDQIVYETPDTAVYEDGRVVTTSLANVGEHLSALGWAENPMQILGASAAPGGMQSSGSDWRSGGSGTARRRG